jgi:hypothetical protein
VHVQTTGDKSWDISKTFLKGEDGQDLVEYALLIVYRFGSYRRASDFG